MLNKKHTIILLFAFTALGIAGYHFDKRQKNINGYCFEQSRYLSDQELIDIAVSDLIAYLNDPESSFLRDSQETVVRYSSLKEFHKQNSDCCSITRPAAKYRPDFQSTPGNGVDFVSRSNTAHGVVRGKFLDIENVSSVSFFSNWCGDDMMVRYHELKGK